VPRHTIVSKVSLSSEDSRPSLLSVSARSGRECVSAENLNSRCVSFQRCRAVDHLPAPVPAAPVDTLVRGGALHTDLASLSQTGPGTWPTRRSGDRLILCRRSLTGPPESISDASNAVLLVQALCFVCLLSCWLALKAHGPSG